MGSHFIQVANSEAVHHQAQPQRDARHAVTTNFAEQQWLEDILEPTCESEYGRYVYESMSAPDFRSCIRTPDFRSPKTSGAI